MFPIAPMICPGPTVGPALHYMNCPSKQPIASVNREAVKTGFTRRQIRSKPLPTKPDQTGYKLTTPRPPTSPTSCLLFVLLHVNINIGRDAVLQTR